MPRDVSEQSKDVTDDAAVFCPACGYDLRGLPGETCPECGAKVDARSMRLAQVPWAVRGEIGRWRALWRTVGRVTFRTRLFCGAVGMPVDYADAVRFRRLVVAVLFITTAAVTAAGLILTGGLHNAAEFFGWGRVIVISTVSALSLWLFLAFATGVHTYWLHPRKLSMERQNRAVALGQYACAPLMMMPFAIPWLVVSLVMVRANEKRSDAAWMMSFVIHMLGWAWLVLCIAAFWSVALAMADRVADRRGMGRWSMLTLPVIWLLLAVFVLAGLPLLAAYVWLMLETM